jgi:hypothetical protein
MEIIPQSALLSVAKERDGVAQVQAGEAFRWYGLSG